MKISGKILLLTIVAVMIAGTLLTACKGSSDGKDSKASDGTTQSQTSEPDAFQSGATESQQSFTVDESAGGEENAVGDEVQID